MTWNVPYWAVIKWNNSVNLWYQNFDIHYALDYSRLTYLQKKIAMVVNKIQSENKEIIRKYFVIEGDQVKMEGEGENKKPVLLEGMKMEDYQAEINAHSQTMVEIKL